MAQPIDHADRLRILVDAGISLSAELSLDALLQRINETAAQLTGARYAALAVVDRSVRRCTRRSGSCRGAAESSPWSRGMRNRSGYTTSRRTPARWVFLGTTPTCRRFSGFRSCSEVWSTETST